MAWGFVYLAWIRTVPCMVQVDAESDQWAEAQARISAVNLLIS